MEKAGQTLLVWSSLSPAGDEKEKMICTLESANHLLFLFSTLPAGCPKKFFVQKRFYEHRLILSKR
jgi:hypothetical protein